MPLDHQRHLRLFGPPFRLHDVRDTEAHVRTLLDATLDGWNARLDPVKYDDALSFLVALCWRLSGLDGDGTTPRRDHFAHVALSCPDTEWSRGLSWSQKLGPFKTPHAADSAAAAWTTAHDRTGLLIATEVSDERPAGAYDSSRGLAFSTFSRRLLSRRLVDWYRDTFGDSRYSQGRREVSLESLAADHARNHDGHNDETWLEHHGPGGRLDFVDDLNRHAYTDPYEEGLSRVAATG